MSTLHLMGLTEEFAQGRKRIEDTLGEHLRGRLLLDWQAGKLVHQEQDLVYNMVNKHLGGLLSCYALTGGEDSWFLERAKEVADFLEPAYGNIPGKRCFFGVLKLLTFLLLLLLPQTGTTLQRATTSTTTPCSTSSWSTAFWRTRPPTASTGTGCS